MKGVFIFNQLNDLIFKHVDWELNLFINELAHKNRLITEEQVNNAVDPNVIIQLFAPVVASQTFMSKECRNPFHTIKCQNGLVYVFRQFSDMIAMAIGTENESEQFLHRKLLVLYRLLTFLYGPVIEQVHASAPEAREQEWQFVASLLQKWTELYQKEQCFLVEAIERLLVNQGLNTKSISLLEWALHAMRSAGAEKHVSHALLIVECKLMTLYSNRSAFDLDSADILLMILLCNTVFPRQQAADLTSSYAGSEKFGQSWSANDTKKSSESDHLNKRATNANMSNLEYSFNSASEARSRSHEHPLSTDDKTSSTKAPFVFDENMYHEWTFLDDKSGIYWDTSGLPHHHPSFSDSYSFPGRNFESRSSAELKQDSCYGNSDSYKTFTAFFNTKVCCHTPVTLHILEVLPGVSLVLVSEIPKTSHASLIVGMLSLVQTLATPKLGTKSTPANVLISSMEVSLKKLSDINKKFKGVLQVEKLLKDVHLKWESVKKRGGSSVARGVSLEGLECVRFESTITSLTKCLKDLFRAVFLTQRTVPARIHQKTLNVIHDIHKRACAQLVDYRDYLCVKAIRNVAITSYIEEFPGLVHFIYVDRRNHYMTAPSIHFHGVPQKSPKDITQVVKDQVWKIMSGLQGKLSSGYTAVTARDSSFYFSYFVWFEDAMGNPLTAQQPFRGGADRILPGVLTGDFYRHLTEECFPQVAPQRPVCCYELLCVHLGLVPTQYVLSHCRKMAAMLWESSEVSVI